MRHLSWPLAVMLSGCAVGMPGTPDSQFLLLDARSEGQRLDGVTCQVYLGADLLTVTPPVRVPVGAARGDLQVVCNKPGYRTAEWIYRTAQPAAPSFGIGLGGGSGQVGLGLGMRFPLQGGRPAYPSHLTMDLHLQE